jgi:hypothetical protein
VRQRRAGYDALSQLALFQIPPFVAKTLLLDGDFNLDRPLRRDHWSDPVIEQL